MKKIDTSKKDKLIKEIEELKKQVDNVEYSTDVVDAPSGWESLLGKKVDVWCLNYIYSGILTGVNDTEIMLSDCTLVYETGGLQASEFKYCEEFVGDRYIQKGAVESYGLSNI